MRSNAIPKEGVGKTLEQYQDISLYQDREEVLLANLELFIDKLPPLVYSPHSNVHWGTKYSQCRGYQSYVAGRVYERSLQHLRFAHPVMEIEFILITKRNRDLDNFTARSDPLIDTFVKLGILEDDNANYLALLPIKFTVDPNREQGTIVRIWESVGS